MKKLSISDQAPDFSLPNHEGKQVQLSEIYKNHHVMLVFNIGFAWPHCTNHMAQLRHDIEKFSALNTKILVMVPNGPFMIKLFLKMNPTPYTILTDRGSSVAKQYFQDKKFLSLGTPTVILVEQGGKIAYAHYADSMVAEPANDEPLAVLAKLDA